MKNWCVLVLSIMVLGGAGGVYAEQKIVYSEHRICNINVATINEAWDKLHSCKINDIVDWNLTRLVYLGKYDGSMATEIIAHCNQAMQITASADLKRGVCTYAGRVDYREKK